MSEFEMYGFCKLISLLQSLGMTEVGHYCIGRTFGLPFMDRGLVNVSFYFVRKVTNYIQKNNHTEAI